MDSHKYNTQLKWIADRRGLMSSPELNESFEVATPPKFEGEEFRASSASGKLEQIEGKYLMTEIILEPILTIPIDTSIEKAERILIKSEAACLISNSIKSKVTLKTNIKHS